MGRRLAYGLLALSAFGEAVALYLTYVHYRLHREPGWQSACAINEQVNCDSVILSPYGSIAGLPLALLGAWFYAITGAIVMLELRASRLRFSRSPAAVLLVAAAVSTAFSAVLAIVSFGSIGSLCLFCSALYAVNIAMLVVGWFALKSTDESARSAWRAELAHWAKHPGRTLIGWIGALTFLLLVGWIYSNATPGGSVVCRAIANLVRDNPRQVVDVRVYSDFECPHCKALDRDLRRFRDRPRLRLVQGHYPIDGTCNPAVKRTRHPGACTQALAALCAHAQGKGVAYSDRLFDGEGRNDADLIELARSLGLDPHRFGDCLEADDTRASLRRSIDEAIAAGVRATPTVLISAEQHVGRFDDDDLRCLTAALR